MLGKIAGVVEVSRESKTIVGKLLRPCLVLSTGRQNGGLRPDMTAVYNHQLCEPGYHHERVGHYLVDQQDKEHVDVCAEHGLDPKHATGLGTAANMNCAGVSVHRYRDVEVLAVATAGVESNAGRAGDPASSYEWNGVFEQVAPIPQPKVGTINVMVFFSQELIPGALTRSLMTATEAKASVLNELVVRSRYSPGLATGTGTDAFIAVCPTGTGKGALTDTGKHSKLGEILGLAVRDAVRQALVLQSGLTPNTPKAVTYQLGRFGFSEDEQFREADRQMSPADATLFKANWKVVERDPMTVASVAGVAAVLDQLSWGVLPRACASEILANYGKLVAAAVSGAELNLVQSEVDEWSSRQVSEFAGSAVYGGDGTPGAPETGEAGGADTDTDPMQVVYSAMVAGFAEKWGRLHRAADEYAAQLGRKQQD